jgi:hypothetical protein
MKAKANPFRLISSIEAVWETEKVVDLAKNQNQQAADAVKAARSRVKAAKRDFKQAKKVAQQAEKHLALARTACRMAKVKHKKRLRKRSGSASSIVPAILAEVAEARTAKPRRRKPPAAKA